MQSDCLLYTLYNVQVEGRVYSKLCENIRIFIKNHKSTDPGANEVVCGPCERESEEENFKF